MNVACCFARIHGKEEMIGQYEEEAEVCKDRNYHQKEQVWHTRFLLC